MGTTVDESQIRDAIATIRELTLSDIGRISQNNKRRVFGDPHRHSEGTQNNETTKFTANGRSLPKISQTQERTPLHDFPKLSKSIQSFLDNRKSALDLVWGQPIQIDTIPLLKAEFIYANPGNILFSQTIAPMHNAAAIYLEGPQYSNGFQSPMVSFYFAWQNPFAYTEVINAYADIAVNGTATLLVEQDGGLVSWVPTATFKILFGETLIFPPTLDPSIGSEIELLAPGLVTEDDFAMKHFQYSYVAIPPQTFVFFEVSFWPNYATSDGYLTADFAFGENYVLCPGVTLEVLKPTRPVKKS